MTYADLDDPAATAPVAPATAPDDGGGGGAPPVHEAPRRRPVDGGALRLVLLALASGVALDVGLRGGPANLVVVIGVVLAVVALVVDGHVEQVAARRLALTALLPIAFLAVWASPWLTLSNLAAAGGLLAGAICLAQSGSPFDTTPRRLALRAENAIVRALAGGGVLPSLLPHRPPRLGERTLRVVVALMITLPVLAFVVALLASADAVFAGLVTPDLNAGPAAGHVVLTLVLAAVVVRSVAAAGADAGDTPAPGRFGALEVTVMLSLATAVMGLFALAQVVATTSGGRRLVEEAGLTPAEYARSGFFQLCWATLLIVGLLALVRALAAPGVLDQPLLRVLHAVVPLLTLGLVGVSLRRMALYDRAFGLTMLRLWVVGAAVWMGVVLLLMALRNLGVGAGRDWLVGGAVAAALALVLVADVTDPEAFVVRHNVDRAEHGAPLDETYLQRLSDDAVPAYLHAQRHAPPRIRRQLRSAPVGDPPAHGVHTLNLSLARATAARHDDTAT
jgi:hypothetical protein